MIPLNRTEEYPLLVAEMAPTSEKKTLKYSKASRMHATKLRVVAEII